MTTYAESTAGIITASKLKTFLTNPYLYKLKRIDMADLGQKEKRHFVIGEAFHFLMEEGEEQFLKRYYIEDGFLKADIIEKILERFRKKDLGGDAEKEYLKALKKLKLPELRAEWFGSKEYAENMQKIALTSKEGEDLLNMYRTCKAQKIRDLGNERYICEERLEVEYKGHKMGAKPDRFLVFDKDGNHADLKMLDLWLLGKTKEEKQKIIEERGLKCTIRDFKTTGDLTTIKKNLQEGWDDYGYTISMAFYYTVLYVRYGLKSTVLLDFVDKRPPHMTEVIGLKAKDLERKLNEVILPGLNKLVEAIENNKFEKPTREEIFANKDLIEYSGLLEVYQEEPTFI